MHRALNGWMLARAPASPAQGLHHHGPRNYNFPYFCTICGLEKLGLVDQNWLERNLSAMLLRTLVVGRRQKSESIEVGISIYMELGAWLRPGEGIGWLAAGTMPNSIECPSSIFFWYVYSYFAILVPFSLPFLFVCVFLLLSLEHGRCFSDLFLYSRPRTGLATTYSTGYG